MFGLQPLHVIVIILVALLFFAPSRLPMLVRGLKKMFSEFRDEASGKSQDSETNTVNPPPTKK